MVSVGIAIVDVVVIMHIKVCEDIVLVNEASVHLPCSKQLIPEIRLFWLEINGLCTHNNNRKDNNGKRKRSRPVHTGPQTERGIKQSTSVSSS